MSAVREIAATGDAWGYEKANLVKGLFYEFLNQVKINSKEKGWIILGENLYGGQRGVIEDIFSGLAVGIHDFKILKSRQLGISTIIRALLLFWIGIFDGATGSLVFDTAQHLEEARQELVNMLTRLPEKFRFPRKKADNRYSLTLFNESRVNLASAGVKESKSSGTLGRGSGISVSHRSELCSYQNTTGMEAYRNALARTNPNRLFIDESTARGFNIWNEIWLQGKKDNHCKCIFYGWWSHPDQIIKRNDPDWEKYGVWGVTDKEKKRIKAVKDQYDWVITPEQLAWIRREMAPTAEASGDAEAEFEGDGLRVQEQPWTEEESFQMTGATFFDPESLTDMTNKHVNRKFKAYSYSTGIEFTDCRIYPAHNAKSVELKIWDEPEDDAVYVVAADVAFGANEKNDRSAIQVMRCYADGLTQAAEYAWPLINSRAFGWVIASLLGYYAGDHSECYLILELNGPGEATWNEIQSLKRQLQSGYIPKQVEEKGLRNVFQNVRNYIYSRSDAMSVGRNYQWKTSTQLKITIMERLRDFVSNGMLHIRSLETLEEMKSVSREGDSIEAQGSKKDDRVIALAMAIRCWEERVRRNMMAQKRTRANEIAKKRLTIKDQYTMYSQHQIENFFAGKRRARNAQLAAARKAAWRSR